MITLLGKFLTVDPGEDTGWSVWHGETLLDYGTTKMWDFSDAVWGLAMNVWAGDSEWLKELPDDLQEVASAIDSIERIVVENWVLYPWKLRDGSLDWDECRTARLIGSLYQAARIADWEYEEQPALIKERAVAAGAENFFSYPLRENRHANDAIMHGVFRNAMEAGAAWTKLDGAAYIEVPV